MVSSTRRYDQTKYKTSIFFTPLLLTIVLFKDSFFNLCITTDF